MRAPARNSYETAMSKQSILPPAEPTPVNLKDALEERYLAYALPTIAPYAASKGGISALTTAMSLSLAQVSSSSSMVAGPQA